MSFKKILAAVLAVVLMFSVALTAGGAAALPEIKYTDKFPKINDFTWNTFTDIKADSGWFVSDVATAYSIGLMNGMDKNLFGFDGTVSVIQAIVMASRINAIYTGATAPVNSSTGKWYDNYVSYAIKAGIITSGQFDNYDAAITRADMAQVFAKALPESEYTAINKVTKIPDVDTTSACAAAILKLYNAGIVTGSDDIGSYNPNSNIKRSEAAAIINRIAIPANRVKKSDTAEGLTEIKVLPQKYNEYIINPYRPITKIGDPFMFYDEDTQKYYMYPTGGGARFKCWSSEDLATFREESDAYVRNANSFGTQNYWAPEVYKYKGAYYMVYSAANADNRHSIGIAKADSPAGPFRDIIDGPLFSPGYNVIDASLLFDDDGKIYLFYSRDCSENMINGIRISEVWGIELSDSLASVIGEPVFLTTPSQSWEYKTGNVLWNEAPYVFKHDGTYYLLYSSNYYAGPSYSVGYATSSSPFGAYEKYKSNPILEGDGVLTSGTGHCSVMKSPDGSEYYLVYHSHTSVTNPSGDRTPCFDKLIIREDGTLAVNGPSVTRQPLPSGTKGLYKVYEGVKITSSYPTLNGIPENLTNGGIAFKELTDQEIYRFEYSAGGCIGIEYDKGITLNSLWIYGVKYEVLSPGSVYAVINGKYRTEQLEFSTTEALAPVVITGSSLPEGTLVSDIKLYFTCFNSISNAISISELITVEQR